MRADVTSTSAAPTTAPTPSQPYFIRHSVASSSQQSPNLGSPQQYQPLSHGATYHGTYQPHTPESAGHQGNSQHDVGSAGDATPEAGLNDTVNDAKRPRACEACRGLKVKCDFDPHNPDGACKRCAKAHRNCVVTVPSRKRQKKTDSRVAELERKIDVLTAAVQAAKSGSVSNNQVSPGADIYVGGDRMNPYEKVTTGGYGPTYEGRSDFGGAPSGRDEPNFQSYAKPATQGSKKPTVPSMVIAGQKRKHSSRSESSTPASSTNAKTPNVVPFAVDSRNSPTPKQNVGNEYTDVIDRGIVSSEWATQIFNRYVSNLVPIMPVVVFPPNTTAAEIRKMKPVLFLAILCAGSSTDYPDLQKTLTKEVMSIYADRIICNGEKTLELIQALQVSTLWYWPPEHFEELKFYQLVHLAAVMAIDINISRKSKSRTYRDSKSVAGLWRDQPWRRTPFPDPESVEARRAWCACYFMACNTSMGLRRPNLIRWTNYLQECVEFLETSADALPSDRTLCQWVRSQHIAEEVAIQFSMDDPFATVSISDSKVHHALKGFERDLANWRDHIPSDVQSRKYYR